MGVASDLFDNVENDRGWVWRITNVLSAVSVVAVLWTINATLPARGSGSCLSTCIANLKQLDEAKEQWALEFKKTTNDVPIWTDLIGADKYIKNTPTCPDGGTYQLNKIGEPPTCSKGGTHVLPQ